MSEGKKIALAVLAGFVLIASLVGLLIYVSDPGHAPSPKYYKGQYVRSVLSGQRGQVVNVRCFRGTESCYYDVRFIGLSITTNTHVVGPDGPVSTEPLSIVEMRDFELIAD